jgi:magnesium transporter
LPLTFIAGVYGMNFHDIPEITWDLGYLYFWMLSLGVVAITLLSFRIKKLV